MTFLWPSLVCALAWTATKAQNITILAGDERVLGTYNGSPQVFDYYPAANGDCSLPVVEMFDYGTVASLSFNGTWVAIDFYLDTVGGAILIAVDDVVAGISNYGPSPWGPSNCQTTRFQRSLSPGNHSLSIINAAGTHIYWKQIMYNPDPVVATVDGTGSATSELPSQTQTPATSQPASKTPLVVGVAVGVVCVLVSSAILFWSWWRYRRLSQGARWFDDQSENKPIEQERMMHLGSANISQANVMTEAQGHVSPYVGVHAIPAFVRRESPRETLQALLAAGLTGSELSAAVRILESDATAGGSSSGGPVTVVSDDLNDERLEAPPPQYDIKRGHNASGPS